MFEQHDRVPHFEVRRLDGSRARYADIWQRRNLLLVLVPDRHAEAAGGYVSHIMARTREFAECETACVITEDAVPGAASPGVVIADRWGEIRFVDRGPTVADLPRAERLLEIVRGIEHECPECQGEAR
jgi:hypothetical protein